MRRISISIAFALPTLLLISICSAQQTATTSQQTATSTGNPANTTKLDGGPDIVSNCLNAQTGRIPIFAEKNLSERDLLEGDTCAARLNA